MEDGIYIGALVAGTAYLIAGVRLIRLAMRTGLLPERLMGAIFLFWSASYVAWYPAMTGLAEESTGVALYFAGRVVSDLATICLAFFLRAVFRPQERWALWLVVATAICTAAGVIGSVAVGDWEGIRPFGNAWWWVEWVGLIVPMVWMAGEGFAQYRMARKRLALGLCDALVCNRYLLWGLTGTAWIGYAIAVVAEYSTYEATGVWSGGLDALVGSIELTAIALIWLVFFPPAIYRRRIEGAPGAEVAEEH